ncbi:MAG: hypothetical protein M1830_009896 [Pleopsidium flavum]|nr:MAG: hypothetical protein M1830_009896 [Pleopsidium flavum]
MTTTEEGWHTLEDGTKLYTKTWKPRGEIKAKVLFVHGFSDHCNAYYTLFPTLAAHSIQTHAFDQRGWGRSVHSPFSRGLTGPTSLVLADISSLLRTLLPSPVPVFLMGHSMGGAEVLLYAARGPAPIRAQIAGYLAEAPFIALHPDSQPSRLKVALGRVAGRWMPQRQMEQKLDAWKMCRDEGVCRAWVQDGLCHDMGTLEGLSGMLERGDDLKRGQVGLEGEGVRVWVGHGSGDLVTSFEASRRFVEGLGVKDKEFRAYEGWFHKLHAEPGEDKITFANDVARWILARSSVVTTATEEMKSKL